MSTLRSLILSLGVSSAALLTVLALHGTAVAAQPPVGLGTATPFAVLAGTTVTNTGPSVVSGDLGVSPGSAVTGFPPGEVTNGTIHAADAVALQAKDDLVTAYDDAAARGPVVDVTSQDLGGRTLVAGVYNAANAMSLTGTVTLDAQGDPNAVFVFQAGSTLITASSSTVALIGGARACNVYWQVGSSATIGTTSRFVGSVLALSSISLQTGATIEGRVLARNGQVSLDTNTVSSPACLAPTPTPTTSPTATPTASPTATPTVSPTVSPTSSPTATPTSTATATATSGSGGSGGSGGSDGSGGSGSGAGGPAGPDAPGGDTPVPTGHPATGRLPGPFGDAAWLGLGLLCLGGAGAAVLRGARRPGATVSASR
ncbi:cell division septation protein DedD [Nocardioides salarius]|uniref:Cell division septation protein DedD n=1 Tax=Nocardioides salarius TaxID=374513 RepID=A0ABS2MCD5_9ACTN|nr:ice-binding family protein [Nocardioides salarius]MBM7508820.1 cell division septation protein DedD [Nocardioides salarius]